MSHENSNNEDSFASLFLNDFPEEGSSSMNYEDYNHVFKNRDLFGCRIDAEKWVRDTGAAHNMFFTVESSKHNRVYMSCECSGKYRTSGSTIGNVQPRNSTGTKKKQCPFQVVLRKKDDELWAVTTKDDRGKHNHPLGNYKHWHTSRAKLKPHEFDMVRNEYYRGTAPQDVLGMLGAENFSNSRHIYNANQKIQWEEMGGLSSMQFFFKLLRDNRWYQESWPAEGTNNVGDIFFANKRSLEIFRLFPQVLLLDSTYGTNRYGLPLFKIICFVPTGKNYHVSFAYLQREKEGNYTWVLQMLKLALSDIREPQIFVTDRELALMNAIRNVFPAVTNLLCRRHIGVDTQKYLAQHVHSKKYEGEFQESWNLVVHAQSEEEYMTAVAALGEKWCEHPIFLQYLHTTWLIDHHHRFVSAWTNQHMHFGTLTTNRVESAHIQLKRQLKSARSDFHRSWRKIAKVVDMQLKAIKGEFEKCKTVHPHVTRFGIFRRLGGIVSHKAIEILHGEIGYGRDWDPDQCNYVLRKTHGLPCACEITNSAKQRISIDPVDIDVFWRTLDFEGSNLVVENEERATAHDLLDQVVKLFKEQASDAEVRMFTERMLLECKPEWTMLDAPLSQRHKGRPKNTIGQRFKSFLENKKKDNKYGNQEETDKGKKKKREAQKKKKNDNKKSKHSASKDNLDGEDKEKTNFPATWEQYMPRDIIPYITGYVNVNGDGNCGFRTLSHFVFGVEKHWSEVRFQIQLELERNTDMYSSILGGNQSLRRIIHKVKGNWHLEGSAPPGHWMDIMELGLAAATAFQRIVVSYSKGASTTYLPLRWTRDPDIDHPPLPTQSCIIGHLNFGEHSGHFIVLELREGHPFPTLHPSWQYMCEPRLLHWRDILVEAGLRALN